MFGSSASGAVTATATAYDADNRQTDQVAGYTGSIASTSSLRNGVISAVASTDGGSNIHTRSDYDADGNVITSYQPGAFTSPATGTSPDLRFTVRVTYDADGQPTQSQTARYDTADPAFTDQSASGNTAQTDQCPTGVAGWPSTVGVCTTKLGYDPAGNRTKITLPTSNGTDGRYISYDYTDDNLVGAVRSPDPTHPSSQSGTTHYEATNAYRYDGAGRPIVSADPLLRVTTTTYNLDGTTQKQTRPDNGSGSQFSQYSYDNDGQQLTVSTPLTGTTAADGQTVVAAATTYYANHQTMTVANTGGETTKYSYDDAGNPASVLSPNGNVTSYTYTKDHLLATVDRPAVGDGTHYRIAYSYDGAQRKTASVNTRVGASSPDGGTQTFDWYSSGRAKAEVGRDSENITRCWNANGDLLEAIQGGSAGNCSSLDGRSVPTSITASANHLVRSYYLDDQLRTATDGTHPATYSWDGFAQPASRQLGTTISPTAVGVTTYAYSDAELLTAVHDSRPTVGSGNWSRSYDAAGQPTSGAMPNGNSLGWTFNADGTVGSQTQTPSGGGNPVEKHAYTYDPLQRVLTDALTQGTTTKTDTYTYTAASRLRSWNDGTTTKYATWDADGNRTCWGTSCNGTPSPADSYTYNADDSLATWTVPSGSNAGQHTVAYDNDGRRISDGNACYNYDGYDRTTATYAQGTDGACAGQPSDGTNGHPGVTYTYDPLDRQSQRVGIGNIADVPDGTTNLGYDGDGTQQTTEVTGTAVTSWVLDDGNNPLADTSGTATKYLVDDGRGNVTAETDSSGSLSCLTRYDPFGNSRDIGTSAQKQDSQNSPCDQSDVSGSQPTHKTANDLLYGGQRRDAHNNNYQLGSRTYDPTNAVFTTPDSDRAGAPGSQPGLGTDPLTANTYTYVNGDPLNYADPSGHHPTFGSADHPDPPGLDAAANAYAHHYQGGYGSPYSANAVKFGFTTMPAYTGPVTALGGSPAGSLSELLDPNQNSGFQISPSASQLTIFQIQSELDWHARRAERAMHDWMVKHPIPLDVPSFGRVVLNTLKNVGEGGVQGFADVAHSLVQMQSPLTVPEFQVFKTPNAGDDPTGFAAFTAGRVLLPGLATEGAGSAASLGRAGRAASVLEREDSSASAAQFLAPGSVRLSQSSVNGVGRIASSMRANGWVGDAIDVVRMPDGALTTIDNTRVVAANYAGIDVLANVHGFDELLPGQYISRFSTPKGGVPSTWGDALLNRIGRQNSGYRNTYPYGSPFTGWNGG